MSYSKIKGAKDLTKIVNESLMQFGRDCADEVFEAAKDVAKKAVGKLKLTGNYEDGTGKYRKGFAVKTYNHYVYPGATVHNKEYRLTHLLEYGHMKANGTGRTRAFKHWETANEEAVQEFQDEVKQRIGEIDA